MAIQIPVSVSLLCRSGDVTFCFSGSCLGTPATISYQLLDRTTVIASGSAAVGGCVTHSYKSIRRATTMRFTANAPYKGGVFGLSGLAVCQDTSENVGVPLKDDLFCCPCGPLPRMLYLTDELGTWPIQVNWVVTATGVRDHVGERVVAQFDYCLEWTSPNVLGCLQPLTSGAPGDNPCVSAAHFYGQYGSARLQPGSDSTSVTYGFLCDQDENGPYLELSASWYGHPDSEWFDGYRGFCCTDAAGRVLTFDDGHCGQAVQGAVVFTANPLGGPCTRTGEPNLSYRRTTTYRGPGDNAVCSYSSSSRAYLGRGDCTGGGFAHTFTLAPPAGVTWGFGPENWPGVYADCNGTLQPPPPGGTSITVSSA